ncbi:hypothetical protein H6P81_010086 [Aristolochia fimbriata]|uniref:Uncharacterized protein n=1 Tax=Aristolochia fimbriata TaxID=158543 RepID=A0AAV7ER46_ARIFI|nr:hypothetical protein H6P81_010086 [Aristolochia fimbriata]
MAFSSFGLTALPAPSTGMHGTRSRGRPLTNAVAHVFQIRCRKVQDSSQPLISRRDATVCLISSVASVLYATSPAEAQPLNLDIGNILKEKLDMVLQKAGLVKKEEPSPPTTEEKSPSGHQFMEQLEILKEKVGLSRDSSSSGEKDSTQGSLVMEKFGKVNEKVRLSTKDDPSPAGEEVALSEKEVNSSGSGKE